MSKSVSPSRRLERTWREHGASKRALHYGITSLQPETGPPARLLALKRGHWSIESRYWVRDVTFGEDRSPLRSGDAPQILAALRHLALTLIRRRGTTRIAAQRRAFAARPAQALRVLGLRPC